MNAYLESVLAAEGRRVQSDIDHALQMAGHHQNELDRHRATAAAGRERLDLIKAFLDKERA